MVLISVRRGRLGFRKVHAAKRQALPHDRDHAAGVRGHGGATDAARQAPATAIRPGRARRQSPSCGSSRSASFEGRFSWGTSSTGLRSAAQVAADESVHARGLVCSPARRATSRSRRRRIGRRDCRSKRRSLWWINRACAAVVQDGDAHDLGRQQFLATDYPSMKPAAKPFSDRANAPPLPVLIRYLCEFHASDVAPYSRPRSCRCC